MSKLFIFSSVVVVGGVWHPFLIGRSRAARCFCYRATTSGRSPYFLRGIHRASDAVDDKKTMLVSYMPLAARLAVQWQKQCTRIAGISAHCFELFFLVQNWKSIACGATRRVKLNQ